MFLFDLYYKHTSVNVTNISHLLMNIISLKTIYHYYVMFYY